MRLCLDRAFRTQSQVEGWGQRVRQERRECECAAVNRPPLGFENDWFLTRKMLFSISLICCYIYMRWWIIHYTYCDNPFMMYKSQTIMLYSLNLHCAVMSMTSRWDWKGEKKRMIEFSILWDYFLAGFDFVLFFFRAVHKEMKGRRIWEG